MCAPATSHSSTVWDLRGSIRAWDGFSVALTEVLQATLVTSDARLGSASGPRCRIEVS